MTAELQAPAQGQPTSAPYELPGTATTVTPPASAALSESGSNVVGLIGFAISSTLINFEAAHVFAAGALSVVAAAILGGGAQLAAGWQSWREGNWFGAASFLGFGALWLTVGLAGLLSLSGIVESSTAESSTFDICWAAFAATLFVASLRLNLVLQLLNLSAALGLASAGLGGLINATALERTGAWLLVAAALFAFYLAAAYLWEAAYGRPILSIGRINRWDLKKRTSGPGHVTHGR